MLMGDHKLSARFRKLRRGQKLNSWLDHLAVYILAIDADDLPRLELIADAHIPEPSIHFQNAFSRLSSGTEFASFIAGQLRKASHKAATNLY